MSLTEARKFANDNKLAQAEASYQDVIKIETKDNERLLQEKEEAILELGKLYAKEGKVDELSKLVSSSRYMMTGFAKAKTAKIVRSLIDQLALIPNTLDKQISVTKECIDWARTENRNFLRQALESRLVGMYYRKQSYNDAIALINVLLAELKKLDDKMMLVEVQFLESKVYHALRNLPKSRASLTAARTSANAIYCPPMTQASLDKMSGILLAEDKDYKTAFSYFYESFETYSQATSSSGSSSGFATGAASTTATSSSGSPAGSSSDEAMSVLKYMLLSKIMLNLSDDIQSLLSSKSVQKFASKDIDAMKAIANAYQNRSLKEFEHALKVYQSELNSDPFIKSHFTDLYDALLEQNLVKVIEPFSCVELTHIANLIGLDVRQVEGKLSQMILDKVFYGVVDQGNGWLFVYDEPKVDQTYELANDTIKHMSGVVDLLYEKAAALN